VVVDAKLSLKAYEAYYTAEDAEAKDRHLKSHIDAMRTHIKSLTAKHYDELEGVRSLDFVLMFVPIEAAFLTAAGKGPRPVQRGLRKEYHDRQPIHLVGYPADHRKYLEE
jgi:DNA recombination protein RmuC